MVWVKVMVKVKVKVMVRVRVMYRVSFPIKQRKDNEGNTKSSRSG